jgi:hypothetical protein
MESDAGRKISGKAETVPDQLTGGEKMPRMKRNVEHFLTCYFPSLAVLVVSAMWALASGQVAIAQQPGQRTFSSPEQASHALFVAVQKDDEKALLEILGPDAKQLISSGDDIEDEQNRINFVHKYEDMHRLADGPDGTATLYIGAENRPSPIPLVDKDGAWHFDTDAAKRAILARRIDQNELATIQICHELVDAENQYYSKPRGDDGVQQYAQRFVSNKGEHNGLYWLEAEDEFESPIDPRVADAGSRNGIAKDLQTGPIPFHGYFFRILKRQGRSAPGGAEEYVVNGKMTRGFAFLAYPAEYGSSGVMTFIVNQDGIVFQKDFGANTIEVAKTMVEYNPNSSWERSE